MTFRRSNAVGVWVAFYAGHPAGMTTGFAALTDGIVPTVLLEAGGPKPYVTFVAAQIARA